MIVDGIHERLGEVDLVASRKERLGNLEDRVRQSVQEVAENGHTEYMLKSGYHNVNADRVWESKLADEQQRMLEIDVRAMLAAYEGLSAEVHRQWEAAEDE